MAHIVIDRRKNDKNKSSVNRQRFMKRVKNQVKEAVKKTIRDGSITDITNGKQKDVTIPDKGLGEPTFSHSSEGGIRDRVFPGNKEFTAGDRIERPKGGGKGSGQGNASDSGEGEDDFHFKLTKEEFLDLFLEDLELPDLVKKNIAKADEWEHKRAGFSVDGNPSRLNIVRSMKQAKGRHVALRTPKKKKIKELEKEKARLAEEIRTSSIQMPDKEDRIVEIDNEIEVLKRKLKAIPFIDDVDLRYNRWEKQPVPTTQAVMFCIMDVSGSMGEWEKEMSKRFFMLLYLFLVRNYRHVDIVFIRHHTIAKEVDEDEFFYSQETGGTLVSPALELMHEIAKERYPTSQWNIFACQASDGDNFSSDSGKVVREMEQKILPLTQYFAYVELDQSGNKDGDLWPHYQMIKQRHPNFAMTKITDVTEIYPVFRGLFEKKQNKR